MIGRHIGNYRIVTELGAGAMGEVYFAEHSVMGRRAAIKIIRQELSGNAEMVERFANEARQVNRIGHPNIVEITDFGQVESRYYIMMELLEGETLEERLERVKRLPPDAALRIALQITAALSAAHELGVVHRDLKPENIYLVSRGGSRDFVKVLDFGIAKLMGLPPRATGMTMPGMLLGTPHYMSPEQCQGLEELDHRSDVYALGVIMYRMLTGELPFDGETLLAVLYAQANDPPRPVRELCPDLPAHLEAVVLKALAKNPADRFQNMAEFTSALAGGPLKPAQAAAAPLAAANTAPAPKERHRTLAHQVTAPVEPPAAAARKATPDRSAVAEKPAPAEAKPAATPDKSVVAAKPAPANAKQAVAPDRSAVAAKPSPANAKQAPAKPVAGSTVATFAKQATADRDEADSPADQRAADAKQGQRVGSRLGRILVERIHKNRLLLPAMPGAARECLKLVDDPNGGLVRVAAAIGRDPVIAPVVLRRARSALLGTHTPVKTIEQAVTRLGARQLRSVLVDLSARRLFESKNPAIRRATRGLWEHSVAVGVLSRAIAKRRRDVDPEAAYLAGLLHDVGKPVAASLLLEAERTTEAAPEEWLSKDAWLDVIHECHREVGTALARSWDLQEEIVLAIAMSQRYSVDGPNSISSVVCFANALVKSQGIYTGAVDVDAVQALVRDGLDLFKIDDKQLETLMTELYDEEGMAGAAERMNAAEPARRKGN